MGYRLSDDFSGMICQMGENPSPVFGCRGRIVRFVTRKEFMQRGGDAAVGEHQGMFGGSMFMSKQIEIVSRIQEILAAAKPSWMLGNRLIVDQDPYVFLICFDRYKTVSEAGGHGVDVLLELDLGELIDAGSAAQAGAWQHRWKRSQYRLFAREAIDDRLVMGRVLALHVAFAKRS